MEESVQPVPRNEFPRKETMETPAEVGAMLRLKVLRWAFAGSRRSWAAALQIPIFAATIPFALRLRANR
jgi:hypothetical protein